MRLPYSFEQNSQISGMYLISFFLSFFPLTSLHYVLPVEINGNWNYLVTKILQKKKNVFIFHRGKIYKFWVWERVHVFQTFIEKFLKYAMTLCTSWLASDLVLLEDLSINFINRASLRTHLNPLEIDWNAFSPWYW